jgi:hypothetical protein
MMILFSATALNFYHHDYMLAGGMEEATYKLFYIELLSRYGNRKCIFHQL